MKRSPDQTISKRAAFIDKDGTLLDNVPYNVDPAYMRLTDHAGSALRALRHAGYTLIVISNQPGIALGRFDFPELARARAHLEALLTNEGVRLDGFYFCPHHPIGSRPEYACECACRKPMPGLLLRAAREFHIDLARSWMIGDILDDIEAATRAGCRSVLLDVGNETEWRASALRCPQYQVPDLRVAARLIRDGASEQLLRREVA
jgi:D-glycero-D-manno-heptose 1,7-bisphosphate phosphatase